MKFKVREDSTQKELTDQLARVKAIRNGDFAELLKVWNILPESQWEMTFQQQMRHLPEYRDLRKALAKFKSNFMRKKTNAGKSTTKQDRDQEVPG